MGHLKTEYYFLRVIWFLNGFLLQTFCILSSMLTLINFLSSVQLECIERNFRESRNKLEALSSRHQATTKALWRLEDALEKYERQEEREAKLVNEIISLKRQ